MKNKEYYNSISLRNTTYKKLGLLSERLINGYTLSRAKTIEILINHYIDKLPSAENKKNGMEPINEPQKI